MLTEQQAVEFFHLCFLWVLKNNIDSNLYAIKGGCNLRFFFESIRYSEDIDLDITIVSPSTLKKKIDSILSGTPLKNSLSLFQIKIENFSAPKQTETVQRWKVSLQTPNKVRSIPTKIEFSRRNLDDARKAEPIQPFILQNYRMLPMILPHYLFSDAVKQKINALILRTETQARDIFDLHHLFLRKEAHVLKMHFDLERAKERILEISFNDFFSQVVTYLLPEYMEHYNHINIWEEMQLSVMDHLEKIYSHETH